MPGGLTPGFAMHLVNNLLTANVNPENILGRHNPGISGFAKGPGSRNFRDPGISIPYSHWTSSLASVDVAACS